MNDEGATPAPEDPVLRDDELLDALRGGTQPPADDPVAALLAGWHTEIEARAARLEATPWQTADGRRSNDPAASPGPDPATLHSGRQDAGAAPPPQGPGATPSTPDAGDAPPTDVDATPAPAWFDEDGSPAPTERGRSGPGTAGLRPTRPGTRRTPRRRGRVLSGAALTLVTLAGGIWLGSARAEPDGLLWPVTELVWTERAQSLVAEREIDRLLDQARRDLGAGRYAEARADLERATTLLADLGDDQRAARLRSGIEDLWHRLPAPDVPASQAPPPPEPGAPAPVPSPGPGETDAGSATPAGEPTGGGSPAHPDRPTHPAPTAPMTDPATTTPTTDDRPDRAARTPVRPAPEPPRPAPATGGADAPGRSAGPRRDAGRPAGGAPPDQPDTVGSGTTATVDPPADPGQPSTTA